MNGAGITPIFRERRCLRLKLCVVVALCLNESCAAISKFRVWSKGRNEIMDGRIIHNRLVLSACRLPVWWSQIRPGPDSAKHIPRMRAQAASRFYCMHFYLTFAK